MWLVEQDPGNHGLRDRAAALLGAAKQRELTRRDVAARAAKSGASKGAKRTAAQTRVQPLVDIWLAILRDERFAGDDKKQTDAQVREFDRHVTLARLPDVSPKKRRACKAKALALLRT